MDTAARLKALRKENGFTRQEFATECNIPYSTLTNYENGTRTPPYTFLLTAAKLFGVTIDYLLCATNDPNPAPWENGLKLAGQCLKVEPGRLRELAEADKEGRVVVLPCKVGDGLWTFCSHPVEQVYSFTVTSISTLNGRTMLNTSRCGVIDARDVGKTVFLTHKEAEKALEAMK